MKRYSIGQFAKKINVSQQTLRNWDKQGKLKPQIVDEKTRYRYYTDLQLNEYYGIQSKERIVVGYCRVSSQKQKEALTRQVENVRTYLLAKGYKFKIISDIGSGIDYNKKGFNELIEMILNDEAERVVILYKDRLVRFGFELIEKICNYKNVELDIIDTTEKTEEQEVEVVEDFIQIITVFSCKLQGKKAKRAKEIIKELEQEND